MDIRGLLRRFGWASSVVVALWSCSQSSSPFDLSHEIEAVGSRWVFGHEILYVQVWSRFTPFMLYVGALYARYIGPHWFFRALFELALISGLYGGFYLIHRALSQKTDSFHYLLLPMSILLVMPGVWQRGVTPTKLAASTLSLATGLYLHWKKSTESFWLFGKTTKNFRFLIGSGICLTIVCFSAPWLSFIIIPFLTDMWRQYHQDWRDWMRWSSILVLPLSIASLITYSALKPRRLLTASFRALNLDRYVMMYRAHTTSFALWLLVILFITGIVVVLTQRTALRQHITVTLALSMLPTFALLGRGATEYTAVFGIAALILCISLKIDEQKARALLMLCSVFFVAVSTQTITSETNRRLENVRLQLAQGYVLQRLNTSSTVLYFGRSSNFYDDDEIINPTPFYDSSVFMVDSERTHYGLEAQLRGSSEAESPLFVVKAVDPSNEITLPDRLNQYIDKHYEQVMQLDGYLVYKRR